MLGSGGVSSPSGRVEVQRVDFDDRRIGCAAVGRHILADNVHGRRCRQHNRGLRIAQHRVHVLVTRAEGNGKRNGDAPRLQRPQEGGDVVEPLRRKYHRTIAG